MLTTIQDVASRSFDYVIVGAGAAGLTLAANLTEEPSTSVLVLEAGPSNLNDPDILRLASYTSHFSNTNFVWPHKTVKQRHANDTIHSWWRGKGLGGSSAVNFMVYTKPPKREMDDLERLGNTGWNWENYQKAMSKVEGFVEPSREVRDRFKLSFDKDIGCNGPLKIAYPGMMHKAEIDVQQTLINAGLPIASSPLTGNPRGVFFAPNTIDPVTHTRSYSATAFYLPNKDRPNFHILVDAHVCSVETESIPGGKVKVVGVTFLYGSKSCFAHANKEVILCAGSLHSPQILELSGIGGRDVLEKIGVPLKLELSGVGGNMQEHLYVGVTWELKEGVAYDTLDVLRDPEQFEKHLKLHAKESGLFTSGMTSFAFASLDALSRNAGQIYEKAQRIHAAVDPEAHRGLSEQHKIMTERLQVGSTGNGVGCEFIVFPGMLSRPNPPQIGKKYVTLVVITNHLWSRGTVHCASNDPRQDPEMDPHYFEQDIDLEIYKEYVKFARSVAKIAPLKDMIVEEVNPGMEVQNEEQLANWIKDTCESTWHSAGTCSMFPKELGGVVDPHLKVYGTDNLRVVDLSVLPLHVAAHPCSVVYGIAAQAADIIKAEAAKV